MDIKMANKKRRKKKEGVSLGDKVVGTGKIAGGALTAKSAIESGVPRLLGVRLEQHSTSRDRARKILQEGYLDPNYGGTGASKSVDIGAFINGSKNYAHVTGYHPDTNKLKRNIPLLNVIVRKLQGGMYRGLAGVSMPPDLPIDKKVQVVGKNFIPGLIGLKGRTIYTPGTDEYFNKEFISDGNDLALKSNKKVKVYGNKLGATVGYLKDKGLRSIPNNMKANKGRVGAGLAILGVGGAWAANDIRKGVDKLTGKDKIYVKSYVKKGKLVKSYSRKNKK